MCFDDRCNLLCGVADLIKELSLGHNANQRLRSGCAHHNPAILAEQRGADYLGVGAVFHTGSKAVAEDVSHETLTAICNAVKIPVIAIGGITRDNVTELSGSGICGIAVISAIFAQKDIVSATKDLKEQTLRMLENK